MHLWSKSACADLAGGGVGWSGPLLWKFKFLKIFLVKLPKICLELPLVNLDMISLESPPPPHPPWKNNLIRAWFVKNTSTCTYMCIKMNDLKRYSWLSSRASKTFMSGRQTGSFKKKGGKSFLFREKVPPPPFFSCSKKELSPFLISYIKKL